MVKNVEIYADAKMTLKETIQYIEELGAGLPNVNQIIYSEDIFDLNNDNFEVEYSTFCVTQRIHTFTEGYVTWNLTVYYVDRLTLDQSNMLDIQSYASQALMALRNLMQQDHEGILDAGFGEIQTFTHRFASHCAGAFMNIGITTTQDDLCGSQVEEDLEPGPTPTPTPEPEPQDEILYNYGVYNTATTGFITTGVTLDFNEAWEICACYNEGTICEDMCIARNNSGARCKMFNTRLDAYFFNSNVAFSVNQDNYANRPIVFGTMQNGVQPTVPTSTRFYLKFIENDEPIYVKTYIRPTSSSGIYNGFITINKYSNDLSNSFIWFKIWTDYTRTTLKHDIRVCREAETERICLKDIVTGSKWYVADESGLHLVHYPELDNRAVLDTSELLIEDDLYSMRSLNDGSNLLRQVTLGNTKKSVSVIIPEEEEYF